LTIPAKIGGKSVSMFATLYTPDGDGPFPAVVISHGSPAIGTDRPRTTGKFAAASAAFVKLGFVVLNPVRRGYGQTGGHWDEDYGRCDVPFFAEAGLESARDITAATEFLRAQPNVDRDRVVLVGVSAGGWGSLAAANRADLVRGVVNFAGGRGGYQKNQPNNNCSPDRLVAAAGTLGKAAKVPTLWIYAENDLFFAPDLARRMYAAWTAAGGNATFHMFPAFGRDGHALFGAAAGVPLWREKVEAFLREIGVLPAR
jgi:dienelactone hydrolase